MLHLNKRMFFSLRPSLDYSLAKQIVVIDESLHSFSVFVSVAVRHFTRWNGINQLWSDEHELVWVGVCIRALVIWHAKRIFSTQHFVAMCDLSGCTRFFSHVFPRYPINVMISRKSALNMKYVLTFSTTFVWNIFHSKKNSARYSHNYTLVFI